ncbi:MAG: transglutaminase domain-containing protein [Planctomycetaceae bacterium]|nr:transglutaminase domain-containing protein [Planctomycetaceae bacterium]
MQPDSSSAGERLGVPLQGHQVLRSDRGTVGAFTDLSSQFLAVSLACVSLVVFAVVAADGIYRVSFYSWLSGQLTVLVLAAWAFRRQAIRSGRQLIVSPVLVLVALLALAWEWASRTLLGAGQPFEVVTMSAVRNLVFGLAAVSVWPAHQRLSVVLSLFLTMFGVTASRELLTQWLAAMFAVGAVCWLVVSHWENVQRRLKGRERPQWPRWVLAVPLVLLMLVGIGAAGADRTVLTAIRGFMPSSGGTGGSDPYARDGVGDGEMLVAGTERIQSFAPIEDAPFMQDDQPSLYDLFDDTYEEEVRNIKTDRAIALPPELASRAREHLHNRTEKAHREFSTLRQPGDASQRRTAPDIRSNALLYVAGRVPLHLRLQTYDLFDGEVWYPEELPNWQHPLEVRTSGGKPWLQLPDRGETREYLGPAETHALKIVRMDSNVIPGPLYLHGVHIDLVDRADMFTRGPDGLVAMDREKLPSLVPIHLASRSIDWDTLRDVSKLFLRVPLENSVSVIPQNIDSDSLRLLADQRTRGADDGWEQIAAITEHLRNDYTLDPDWRPDPNGRTGVEQFLFESRRGPDYQFATAAALLLRSQGYATRVVSGFYVDPDKYDPDSRHTPVLPNDVHFWVELRVSGGDWVTVEATPGFAVLGPPPGILQRVWNALVAAALFVANYWLTTCFLAVVSVWSWWTRRQITNALYSVRWRLSVWWSSHDAVRSTIELLRQRARLAGMKLQTSTTHHQWLSELIAGDSGGEQARVLYAFRREIDAAAYSGNHQQPSGAVLSLCSQVVGLCSLTWFRDAVLSQSIAAKQSRTANKVANESCVERVGI